MSHRTALIALTILGLAYVFVTPPFRVPDEDTHFWRGIAIGMGHLLPNGGGKPDSAKIPQGLKTFPFVMSWVDARGRFSSGQFRAAFPIPLEQQKQPVVYFPAWYTPVPYLPQAVTVAIARLFDIRPMFAFYAARLANLFAALALIGIALHVADGLRTIIAAVALLPMTLFEFASWSPDAMSIAASILFISLLLRAMSADVSAVALCTTAFLVGLCKPAYFLTAFLVLLIPRKRIALLVLLSTAVATVLSFSYAHMAAYAQRGALPIDPASQIQCIVSAPARFVSVVSRDVATHAWSYLEGIVAHFGYGYSEIRLPVVVTSAELLLLIAAGLSSKLSLRPSARLLAAGIFIATVGGVLLSQYLIWSIICGDVIEGVQGRYFLPVLPLALMSIHVRRIPRLPMGVVIAAGILANIIALGVLARQYWW